MKKEIVCKSKIKDKMKNEQTSSTLELVNNQTASSNTLNLTQNTTLKANESTDQDTSSDEQHGFLYYYWLPIKEFPTKLYQAFKNQCEDAKQNSDSNLDFASTIAKWLSGTLIWALCLAATIAMPVIVALVGLFNIDECSAKPSLPYFMFATGFLMTFSNIFNLALSLDLPILSNHKLLTADLKNIIASLVNILLNCIVMFTFLITTYLVFTTSVDKHITQNIITKNSTKINENRKSTKQSKLNVESPTPEVSLNCPVYGFAYVLIVTTLFITLIAATVSALAFAYKRYTTTIKMNSNTSHSNLDL